MGLFCLLCMCGRVGQRRRNSSDLDDHRGYVATMLGFRIFAVKERRLTKWAFFVCCVCVAVSGHKEHVPDLDGQRVYEATMSGFRCCLEEKEVNNMGCFFV